MASPVSPRRKFLIDCHADSIADGVGDDDEEVAKQGWARDLLEEEAQARGEAEALEAEIAKVRANVRVGDDGVGGDGESDGEEDGNEEEGDDEKEPRKNKPDGDDQHQDGHAIRPMMDPNMEEVVDGSDGYKAQLPAGPSGLRGGVRQPMPLPTMLQRSKGSTVECATYREFPQARVLLESALAVAMCPLKHGAQYCGDAKQLKGVVKTYVEVLKKAFDVDDGEMYDLMVRIGGDGQLILHPNESRDAPFDPPAMRAFREWAIDVLTVMRASLPERAEDAAQPSPVKANSRPTRLNSHASDKDTVLHSGIHSNSNFYGWQSFQSPEQQRNWLVTEEARLDAALAAYQRALKAGAGDCEAWEARLREKEEAKKRRVAEEKRSREETEARENQTYICGCIPVGGGGGGDNGGGNTPHGGSGASKDPTSTGDGVELARTSPRAGNGAPKDTETKDTGGGGGGAAKTAKTAKQRKLERLRALHQKRAQAAGSASVTTPKPDGKSVGRGGGGNTGNGKDDDKDRRGVSDDGAARLFAEVVDPDDLDYFDQFDLLARVIIQTLNPAMQTPERQVAFVDKSADSWSIEGTPHHGPTHAIASASMVEISLDGSNGESKRVAGDGDGRGARGKVAESKAAREAPRTHILQGVHNLGVMALLQDFGAYYGVGELYQTLSELTAYVQNLRGALMAPQHLKSAEHLLDHVQWITARLQRVGVLSFNPGPEQTPPTQRELDTMQRLCGMLNDRVRPALKQYKKYFPANEPKGLLEALLNMAKSTAQIAAFAQGYATGTGLVRAMQDGTRSFGEFVKDSLRGRAARTYYKYVKNAQKEGGGGTPPPRRRGGGAAGGAGADRRAQGGQWQGGGVAGSRWKPYSVEFDKRNFGFRAELDITENFVKVVNFKRKAKAVLSQAEEYGLVQLGDRLVAVGDWPCSGQRIEAVMLKLALVPRPCRLRFETLVGANGGGNRYGGSGGDDSSGLIRQVRLEVERAAGIPLTVGRRYYVRWEYGKYKGRGLLNNTEKFKRSPPSTFYGAAPSGDDNDNDDDGDGNEDGDEDEDGEGGAGSGGTLSWFGSVMALPDPMRVRPHDIYDTFGYAEDDDGDHASMAAAEKMDSHMACPRCRKHSVVKATRLQFPCYECGEVLHRPFPKLLLSVCEHITNVVVASGHVDVSSLMQDGPIHAQEEPDEMELHLHMGSGGGIDGEGSDDDDGSVTGSDTEGTGANGIGIGGGGAGAGPKRGRGGRGSWAIAEAAAGEHKVERRKARVFPAMTIGIRYVELPPRATIDDFFQDGDDLSDHRRKNALGENMENGGGAQVGDIADDGPVDTAVTVTELVMVAANIVEEIREDVEQYALSFADPVLLSMMPGGPAAINAFIYYELLRQHLERFFTSPAGEPHSVGQNQMVWVLHRAFKKLGDFIRDNNLQGGGEVLEAIEDAARGAGAGGNKVDENGEGGGGGQTVLIPQLRKYGIRRNLAVPLTLINLNLSFSPYVVGWIESNFQVATAERVETAIEEDEKDHWPCGRGDRLSHSPKLIYWLADSHLALFKELPGNGNPTHVVRFARQLICNLLHYYANRVYEEFKRRLHALESRPLGLVAPAPDKGGAQGSRAGQRRKAESVPELNPYGLEKINAEGENQLRILSVQINCVYMCFDQLNNELVKLNQLDVVGKGWLADDDDEDDDEDEDGEGKGGGGGGGGDLRCNTIKLASEKEVVNDLCVHQLDVSVYQGQNLPKMDGMIKGMTKSDPYVKVRSYESEAELAEGAEPTSEAQTEVIKKSSNPRWGNEEFGQLIQLETVDPSPCLVFEVWDEDDGPDDLMGRAKYKVAQWQMKGAGAADGANLGRNWSHLVRPTRSGVKASGALEYGIKIKRIQLGDTTRRQVRERFGDMAELLTRACNPAIRHLLRQAVDAVEKSRGEITRDSAFALMEPVMYYLGDFIKVVAVALDPMVFSARVMRWLWKLLVDAAHTFLLPDHPASKVAAAEDQANRKVRKKRSIFSWSRKKKKKAQPVTYLSARQIEFIRVGMVEVRGELVAAADQPSGLSPRTADGDAANMNEVLRLMAGPPDQATAAYGSIAMAMINIQPSCRSEGRQSPHHAEYTALDARRVNVQKILEYRANVEKNRETAEFLLTPMFTMEL